MHSPVSPTVVFICMPETGHVQRTIPVINHFCRRNYKVHVHAHRQHRSMIEAAGGDFVDLFTEFPVEAADNESIPIPIRYVSYAARFFEEIKSRIEPLDPDLIVYDSFSVVAPLIATRIGKPYINICSGHNRAPARSRLEISKRPNRVVSASCLSAIDRFNRKHGFATLDPYSFTDALSPHLNLYCEPPQFLLEDERPPFEPVAFFGSIDPDRGSPDDGPYSHYPRPSAHKVYVSFGTVVWKYRRQLALDSMATLAKYFAGREETDVIFSLGGTALDERERTRIRRAGNISVESYVDQWQVLKEADLFVTHHGLNSTHEAIFHEVPMLSHPFTSDQPDLARRCQEFGVAIPLVEDASDPLREDAVVEAVDTYLAGQDDIRSNLRRARNWELETIENRASVIQTIEKEIIGL